MKVVVASSKKELGTRAARDGAEILRRALRANGYASIILATGASQFATLAALVTEKIDWHRVTVFHLDEYVALPITHPASFRKYLWERFVSRLPLPLAGFHYVNGEADPAAECRRLNKIIARHTIDVAFIGIGENGHLAFNDPPADFKTMTAFIVVELDEACRKQQAGEGWFKTMRDVPKLAISMSVREILRSEAIVCSVPDRRKADAVRKCVEGEISPDAPCSILQTHEKCTLYLDKESASLLKKARKQPAR
jgi:glucosamine-6-phosphate deaminase